MADPEAIKTILPRVLQEIERTQKVSAEMRRAVHLVESVFPGTRVSVDDVWRPIVLKM